MNKFDFISLIKNKGLYENNSDYLSYLYALYNKDFASKMLSTLKEAKPRFIHDVWSAYAYGNTIKLVYTKKRYTPKMNKDFNYIPEKTEKAKTTDGERLTSSVSRARARVFELAACNEFQHFCTFTVNEKMKNRFDLSSIRKDLAQLVRNINRDNPDNDKLKYLFIPEQHKKGGWHIHGLMCGLAPYLTEFSTADNIPLKLKKAIKNGEKIYNFPRYSDKFGFFTATPIKDKNACSVYLTKYISKEMGKTLLDKGQHLFFASQGLKGREVLAKNCADIPPFDDWDFENDYVKIKTIQLSEKADT